MMIIVLYYYIRLYEKPNSCNLKSNYLRWENELNVEHSIRLSYVYLYLYLYL